MASDGKEVLRDSLLLSCPLICRSWAEFFQLLANVWVFLCPPNLSVEILVPKDNGFSIWGLWMVLRASGKRLREWRWGSYKRGRPHRAPSPLCSCETKRDGTSYESERGSCPEMNMLTPWSWTSHPPELWEIIFYCLQTTQGCGMLLQKPQ